MKYKKAMVSVLSMSVVLGATAIPVYAQAEKQTVLEQEEIVPYVLVIKTGSIDDEDFTHSVKLNKDNGKYINFWIKNTGNKDIAITINGDARRVIEPEEQGHIYVEASMFSKTYKFHAESANSAGKISMDYRIAQRDELIP